MNSTFCLSLHSFMNTWLLPPLAIVAWHHFYLLLRVMSGFLLLLSIFHFNQISLVWLVEEIAQEVPQPPKDDLANEFCKRKIYFGKKKIVCAQCIAKQSCLKGEYLLISILLCHYNCSRNVTTFKNSFSYP